MKAISIHKFLSRYYGMSISMEDNFSHKEIKKRFRFLKRCSFKYANLNPNLVSTGKIIYVFDTYGESIPYICPEIAVSSLDTCGTVISVSEIDNDDLFIDEILELPTYLLKEFLAKYKNKPSFYKLIKKELTSRGLYENKKYKLDKEKQKCELEESELTDKYQRRQKIKYT